MPSGAGADDRFAALERAITRVVRRAILPTTGDETRREAGVPLERATYTTLVRIADLEGGRLSDLAATLGLDLSTTSRHVKRLVDAGYVTLAPDPQDARARLATPTPAGHEALARVRDTRRRKLAAIVADWRPAEVEVLAASLERLVDAVEATEAAEADDRHTASRPPTPVDPPDPDGTR